MTKCWQNDKMVAKVTRNDLERAFEESIPSHTHNVVGLLVQYIRAKTVKQLEDNFVSFILFFLR